MLQLCERALRLNIPMDSMLLHLPPRTRRLQLLANTYHAPHQHLLSATLATLANTCPLLRSLLRYLLRPLHTAATDYHLPSPATRATPTARPYLNIKLLLPPNAATHTLTKQYVTSLP